MLLRMARRKRRRGLHHRLTWGTTLPDGDLGICWWEGDFSTLMLVQGRRLPRWWVAVRRAYDTTTFVRFCIGHAPGTATADPRRRATMRTIARGENIQRAMRAPRGRGLAVVYCEHAKKSGMWLISH